MAPAQPLPSAQAGGSMDPLGTPQNPIEKTGNLREKTGMVGNRGNSRILNFQRT